MAACWWRRRRRTRGSTGRSGRLRQLGMKLQKSGGRRISRQKRSRRPGGCGRRGRVRRRVRIIRQGDGGQEGQTRTLWPTARRRCPSPLRPCGCFPVSEWLQSISSFASLPLQALNDELISLHGIDVILRLPGRKKNSPRSQRSLGTRDVSILCWKQGSAVSSLDTFSIAEPWFVRWLSLSSFPTLRDFSRRCALPSDCPHPFQRRW